MQFGHLREALVNLGAPRPCEKHPHASQALAEAAIRSLERRGLHRPEEGVLIAFKCPRCGNYHTGHRAKGHDDARR